MADISFVSRMADKFGSQAVAVSMDVEQNCVLGWNRFNWTAEKRREFMWRVPFNWAVQIEKYGAGEILLGNTVRDGTMQGYDLGLIRRVSNAVNIPVIASGGCSGVQDMADAIAAGAHAVAAGALFQFTDATPAGMAQQLDKMGIEVRL